MLRARGRLILFGAGGLALLFVAAAAGWWFFIREDNDLATSAPEIPADLRTPDTAATDSPTTGSSSTSGSQTFKILPDRSEAAYFADENLASLSLPSTAKGTTKAITGEFHLTPQGLDASKTTRFAVDLRTLRSDESRRDSRVQSDGLQTSRFPTATFTATKLSGFPEAFPQGQEVAMKLTGTLDLHGVQKEVTWDVQARKEGNLFSALATVNFKYAEFNIPVLNIAGFVRVEDDVTLQVQVVAQAN